MWYRFLGFRSSILILILSLGPAFALLAAQDVPTPQPPAQQEPSAPGVRTIEEVNKQLFDMARVAPGIKLRDEYRIGPEDLLDVNVFEVPELTRVVRVSGDGSISLPLIGRVMVAGLSASQLQRSIADELRGPYVNDPQVSIFVREFHSQPVMVMGSVAKSGIYNLQGSKTLLEVLAEAGGLAGDAGQIVRISRRKQPAENLPPGATAERTAAPDTERIEIDMEQLLRSGNLELNVPIYGGDIINVEKAGIVYVSGEVGRPGGYVLKNRGREQLTVLQILALAGGVRPFAAKKQSRIIRTDDTGQRHEIALNLDKVLAGKAEDPVLRPDDILFVPGSAARPVLNRAIESAIALVTGVVIWRR